MAVANETIDRILERRLKARDKSNESNQQKKLEKLLVARPVKDRSKLPAQQAYYQRLKKSGLAFFRDIA